MSQNLRNPSILHRDYGATSTNQMNAITRIPDVTFSPTEFMHLSENIGENIQSVKQSWQQLERLYKTINSKNRNATDSQKEKIHTIQAQTNQKIQTTSKDLSRLTTVVQRGDKQQKLQLEKLTSEFQTTVNKYSEVQQQIAKLMKQLVLLAATQQQDENTNNSNDNDREELLQRQLQIQNMQFENDLMHSREVKIREIEADVLDVNAIMRELNSLVNQQGETIDTIESSVDYTASNVEGGAAQLLKAAEYRTRYRKKVFILLVIAVIVGLIITGIIVAQFSNK